MNEFGILARLSFTMQKFFPKSQLAPAATLSKPLNCIKGVVIYSFFDVLGKLEVHIAPPQQYSSYQTTSNLISTTHTQKKHHFAWSFFWWPGAKKEIRVFSWAPMLKATPKAAWKKEDIRDGEEK